MTQLELIKEQIKVNGYVSRNWCLSNYISRLGARISDLKAEGWRFEPRRVETIKPDGSKGFDYIYEVQNV
jgi:hypothetical protein